jgi:excisionase family DNA binding protein
MAEIKKKYLTMQVVAETLSCTERHVYDLIVEGSLKAIKIGGRAVRISEESLEEFIKNHEINPEDLFDPELENEQQKQNKQIARSEWIAR